MIQAVGLAQSPTPDEFNPGAQNEVYALAVQPDGRVLVGGKFIYLAGEYRSGIGRLYEDGALDQAFAPNPGSSGSSRVNAIAVQPDGHIVVGGLFNRLGGYPHNYIGRLNPDGSADPDFTSGTDREVYCLAIQPDGKVLVGGTFTSLAGQSRENIGRLNPDGTLDTAFNPGADGLVHSIAVQLDGKVLVGGTFTTLGGEARSFIGRLLEDGTVDAGFDPGANHLVYSIAVQPDGKILAGGAFRMMGGQSRISLARLNADGSLDSGFTPQVGDGIAGAVRTISIQADGKIVVGGGFSEVNGQARTNIARLHPDGTIDGNFNPGVRLVSEFISPYVHSLAVQSNGRILVGGRFAGLGGQDRINIGRLNNAPEATETLSLSGDELTWMRGGSGPGIWRATFEVWSGGIWSALGAGTRVTGGWQLGGLSLASNATVRARGFATGGLNNGSSWFVETQEGPLIITSHPAGLTNNAGDTASLMVSVIGSAPRTYQWHKDGSPLVDAGTISGAATSTLSLNGLQGSDAGDYFVTISNIHGAVTSGVARLNVVDPFISSQPSGQSRNAGQEATFQITAGGTPPLTYQWRKEGMSLSGGTNAILTLTNVSALDAGDFDVVVSNAFGTGTSTVATLVVADPFISGLPTTQTVNLGESVSLEFTSGGTPPLSYQWLKDAVALSDATNSTLTLTNVQASDAGIYELVVTNLYGGATSPFRAINVNLAPPDSFNPEANYSVDTLALQSDGRILVGGGFTTLGKQIRTHVGRLNADGTLDETFNPGANYSVYAVAVQADDKLLVAGSFTVLGGLARHRIGRLNADGTLDVGFNPVASDTIYALGLQKDGRIVVGGNFAFLVGQGRDRIARLNADGTLDDSFDPGADGPVYSIMLQADGKVLVGGAFSSLGGVSRANIGRLNADGSVDIGFDPGAGGVHAEVNSFAIQADGKILVGGRFTALGGVSRTNLGRLNPDGSVDIGFDPGVDSIQGEVDSVAIQTDGKILVGGRFTALGGVSRANLGRLNPDGSVDGGFAPSGSGSESYVHCLTVQSDGKILVGGSFKTLAGESRSSLGRLNNTDPATQSLDYDGATLTWLRGGSSPEAWRTTFEASTNGATWSLLGEGSRVPGGWEAPAPPLPPGTLLRARGFITGGYYSSSSGIVETSLVVSPLTPPRILVQDGAFGVLSNTFGFTVHGLPSQAIVIEATTDFVQWTPVWTNLMTSPAEFVYRDVQYGADPHRFYRARVHEGPLPPPAILNGDHGPGFLEGQFGFHISGVAGQWLITEASTNLVDWFPMQTNHYSGEPIDVIDIDSADFPSRFYRVRLLP